MPEDDIPSKPKKKAKKAKKTKTYVNPVAEEANLMKEFDINEPAEWELDDDDDRTINDLIKQLIKDDEEMNETEVVEKESTKKGDHVEVDTNVTD